MKSWHRYALAVAAGLAIGGGMAWHATGNGFRSGAVTNGAWSTSLDYGTKASDELTRAAVARRGLLALPKTETVYWAASTDSSGAPLDGSCTYSVSGVAPDSRWWSITLYDKEGYLIANPANIWSFSGAALSPAEKGNLRLTIGPKRPAAGHWLPGAPKQGFELTLRMYNPGAAFMKDPARAPLPVLKKEGCA
ncbi:MAG: DUF1214 domain-containing protein [Chakrabartia sp.]